MNVQYGSPGGLAGNRQVLTQGTPEAGDRFGAALAKGRFNDDDFIDLAVGAPDEDLGRTDAAGVVTVFYGSASGLTGPGDILQQTSALRAAVDSLAVLVLEDHVQGCVRTAAERGEADKYVDEVVDVVRRTLGRPVRSATRS